MSTSSYLPLHHPSRIVWGMPRNAAATRERILTAAITEFTDFGLAGARIDRIAETAEANKRSIYVYFESKEGLFNAAIHRVITELTAAVPVTEHDLPGYAGRMFDYLLDHPQAVRMSLWRLLERPSAGPDTTAEYAEKVERMAARDRDAVAPDQIRPSDLIVLVLGLASSWLTSPQELLAADGSDPRSPARLLAHRAAVVEAARRVCEPPRVSLPTAARAEAGLD